MSMKQLLETRKDFAILTKMINKLNRSILKNHKTVTAYHWRKFLVTVQATQTEGEEVATFIYNNNTYAARLTDGKIELMNRVVFYVAGRGHALEM